MSGAPYFPVGYDDTAEVVAGMKELDPRRRQEFADSAQQLIEEYRAEQRAAKD